MMLFCLKFRMWKLRGYRMEMEEQPSDGLKGPLKISHHLRIPEVDEKAIPDVLHSPISWMDVFYSLTDAAPETRHNAYCDRTLLYE